MPRLSDPPIPKYRRPGAIGEHYGIVTVTGSLEVDLGIGHNNYIVELTLMGAISAIATDPLFAWDYHATKKGVFVITVGKFDTAFGPLILATTAKNFSFVAREGTTTNLY